MGNTPKIAMQHYLMVRDEDFEAAIKGEPNAAQYVHVLPRNEPQEARVAHEKPRHLPRLARGRISIQPPLVGDTGLEPVTSTV